MLNIMSKSNAFWFFVANLGILVLFTRACVFRSITTITDDAVTITDDAVNGSQIDSMSSTTTIHRLMTKVTRVNVTGSIVINTTQRVHTTDRKFLSVAIDPNTIRKKWNHFDFKSTKLMNLARALSPAIFRLGGTDADFLIFNETANEEDTNHEDPDLLTNFTMTADDWDKINNFVSDAGWDFLFDLNMLLRRGTAWDSSNAIQLMQYTVKKGFKIAGWELGNEPNHISHHANITVPATQLAKDFITLRQLLDQQGFQDSFLVGPDANAISLTPPNYLKDDVLTEDGQTFLKSFLRVCGNSTVATTWHSYYINSKYVTPDNMTDYKLMNSLKKQIDKVQKVIQKHRPSLPKSWLGETAGVSGGGYAGYSNAYAGGFLWVDKLGLSARHGLDLVIRQSFYGSHYGLVDEISLDPTPSYWISLLYKTLVGPEVLDVNITLNDLQTEPVTRNSNHVRAYAHCTRNNDRSGLDSTNGSITLFLINLQKTNPVSLTLGGKLVHKPVQEYLLLPHDGQGITARTMDLNGKELVLSDSGEIPDWEGEPLGIGEPIVLPPLSYGFYVIADAKASACLT